ncbi:MAG: glycosyltransferase [Planctomycetes bacterium]|nr:glycosyltransferase [Planctomycetota bacterium]
MTAMADSTPRRIAYWLEYPTISGGERSLLALVGALDRRRYEPFALMPADSPVAAALRKAGVEVAADPGDDRQRTDWLRQHTIALIHANSLAMGCRSGPLGLAAGVPAVAHVRDIMRIGRRRREALLLNRRLLAVSRAVAEALSAQGVERARLQVIYNGIDASAFPPRAAAAKELRHELGLAADCPVVGNVGQICLRKGQDLFLRAAGRIAAAAPDAHFALIGARFSTKAESRAFDSALRETASRPPLAGRVHFLGWRADASRLIAGLSVLAHSAHQEPLGRVLLEALAAGTPVVATAVGGTAEIIEDEVCGLLVPPADDAALADAVLRLLDRGPLAGCLAAAGRDRVWTRFDPAVAAARVQSLYDEVLAAGRSPDSGNGRRLPDVCAGADS